MAEPESSRPVPRRNSRSKEPNSPSCTELFLMIAFVAFAATTCFYTGQFVFISICHLMDVMKFQLAAFGVQVFPFWSKDKLPHLCYSSSNALPWGLAALGVYTGSKLMLVPIQICKVRLAYITISVAAMNWESNFKNQIVALASIEAFELAFIFLVFLVMACASPRPGFYYYYASGGKEQRSRKREVKINMVRRVEEGEVDTLPRSVEVEVERMKRDMETALWKKEEELVVAKQGVDDQDAVAVEVVGKAGIYPVLDSPV